MRTPDQRIAAFHDLHDTRLHGFALIVALGDRERAGQLAATALARAEPRIGELRHPERAAAWLRAVVVDLGRRPNWGRRRPENVEQRAALQVLGIDDVTFDALARLNEKVRGVVAAALIERLKPSDVADIVGGIDQVRRARRRYLSAYAQAARARGYLPPAGELAARFRTAADAMAHRT